MLNLGDVGLVQPAGFRVFGARILNVHRGVIDQPRFDHSAQHVGAVAVGVQLDGEAEGADLLGERGQVLVQRRLAAGDADAVKDAGPLLQEREERLLGHLRLACAGQNERAVLAEGTAEIAAAQKDRAGCFFGKIEQG